MRRPKLLSLTVALTIATATLGLAATPAFALDVSVLDAPYNAAGNGTTNDRPAIQSAIDAVSAAGGGTVNLPGGHVYLTGDLTLKTGVTLNVNQGATLKQSTTLSHYAHPTSYGRTKPGGQFFSWADTNYPLVYAGNTSNVHVAGTGTIQMSDTGNENTSVMEHTIGFHKVSNFSIKDITIDGANAYNMTIRTSDHGTISGVKTINPPLAWLNSDGVSLMNSQFIDVFNNNLTTRDDGIYIWASYDDPRRSDWWDSDTPRQSSDVNIYNNVVDNQNPGGSHGFNFINWTAAAPDASLVEIARINVHDNRFKAPYPIGAHNSDVYHTNLDRKTPSKDLKFKNNILEKTITTGGMAPGISEMATTGLTADDPVYNFGRATNVTGIYNRGFDAGPGVYATQVGTSFWSTEGGASAPSTPVGQPSGRYGQIADFRQYAGIYQGVYLVPGTYKFEAMTQSSGAAVEFFAIRATGTQFMANTRFTHTTWQPTSITFTVTQADTYRLGIHSQGAGSDQSSFGRIDSTLLTKIS